MKNLLQLTLFCYVFLFDTSCQSINRKNRKSLVTYNDLKEAGLQCYPGDLCFGSILLDSSITNEEVCNCDSLCYLYNDCCFDASPKKYNYSKETMCIMVNDAYISVVHKCPQEFDDEESVNLCEQDPGVTGDNLANFPATSRISNITYKNIFCLYCHEQTIDSKEIYSWGPVIRCPVNQSIANSEYNIPDLMKRLAYDPLEKKWSPIQRNDPTFQGQCKQESNFPNDLEYIHFCHQNVIAKCAPNWKNQKFKIRCKAYTAYVKDVNDNVYRNIHCARCNYVSENDVQCIPKILNTFYAFGNDISSISLSTLFDVNLGNGNELVGRKRYPCPNSQMYDPYQQRCRPLTCGRFARMRSGKCELL